ncbi:hypothetical protein [Caulobacter endophyticus]|uniref:hypothetical protein n=1 Tax=Caulobacter endophyticus TaxID=2172652 RepID=UPI0011B2531B|nr:hypothetical protein [Caulobacter endophyticus]
MTVLATSGLAGWAWMALLDTAPPWDLLSGGIFLLETPLFIWLASRVKNPAPGAPPEEMAADAFFRDPPRLS